MTPTPHHKYRWRRALTAATATLIAATLAGCSGTAASEKHYSLHYTTYSGANSDQSRTMQNWAKLVNERTNGRVEIHLHYSQSLVSGAESARATLDGRADLSQVGSIYAASDLPLFTVAELPFEVSNPQVHMKALQRLYQENETYRTSFQRQGLRPLFPLPIGIATIGLADSASTVSDLKGRSIRANGLSSELLLNAGANPVAMAANDVYESMSRGIVSGYTALALANLSTFGLSKNTPVLVDPGIGAYGSSAVVINSELFEGLPADIQNVMLEASEESLDYGLTELDNLSDSACNDLIEFGTTFVKFSDEDVQNWKSSAGIAEKWVARYTKQGFDAQGVLNDYRKLIAEESDQSTVQAPLTACMAKAGGVS